MLGSLHEFIQFRSQQLQPIQDYTQYVLNQFQTIHKTNHIKTQQLNSIPKLKSKRVKSVDYMPSDKSFLLRKCKRSQNNLINQTESSINFRKQSQKKTFKQNIEKINLKSKSLELNSNQKQRLRHGHYLLRSIARIQQQEQQSAKSFLQLSLQKINKGMIIHTAVNSFQAINKFKKAQTLNQSNQFSQLQRTQQLSKINDIKQTICNSPSKINNKNRIRLQKCKVWAQKRQKSLKMLTDLKPILPKPFKIDLKERKNKLKQVKHCVQVLTEEAELIQIDNIINNQYKIAKQLTQN